jgi:hypothetical protein
MEFTRISYKFSNDKVNQSLSRPDYHIILRNRYRSRTVGTDRPAGKQYREMMIVLLIALLVLQFSRCSMFYCFRSLTFCTWFILYPICQKNGGEEYYVVWSFILPLVEQCLRSGVVASVLILDVLYSLGKHSSRSVFS